MGIITDANGRSIKQEEAKPSGNGQSHGPEKQDVRGVPTGTIIYNLIRVTGEEVGLEGFVHQMEQAKEAKKMVTEPPQLVRAKQVLAQMGHNRTVLALELNERFKHIDLARCAELGIQVFVPPPPEPDEQLAEASVSEALAANGDPDAP